MEDNDFEFDEQFKKKPFYLRIDFCILLVMLILASLLLFFSFHPSCKLAYADGQIIEIQHNKILVNVKNLVVENRCGNIKPSDVTIENPLEVEHGICFNEYMIDNCQVGTYVRMAYYINTFGEGVWIQEAIIYAPD